MKKVVLMLVAAALAALMVVALFVKDTRRRARQEWPMGLGTLDSVAARTDLDGGPLITARIPDVRTPMKRSGELTASALERAKRGDAGAWDDLHEQWKLSRELWRRPEFIAAFTALAIDEKLVAAARQMPGPEPAWFADMRTFDYRKAMLSALQADTWRMGVILNDQLSRGSSASLPGRVVDMARDPYLILARSDLLAHQRDVAEQIANGRCTFREPASWNQIAQMAAPNMSDICRRLLKLEAELKR